MHKTQVDLLLGNKWAHLYYGNITLFSPKTKGLKIAHWNIQCLTNKIDQIKLLIQDPKHQPDVLGLTETWLNSSYNEDFVKILGYHHPPQKKDGICAAHGGIISYVSERYKYDRQDDMEISNIETIWIEIKPINAANILVCTVYRPDELDSLARWSEQFENEMENAYLENKEIIIMGDFNIDLMRPDEVPHEMERYRRRFFSHSNYT